MKLISEQMVQNVLNYIASSVPRHNTIGEISMLVQELNQLPDEKKPEPKKKK